MKSNKKGVKLLAAAIVLVMAFSAVSIIGFTDEFDAAYVETEISTGDVTVATGDFTIKTGTSYLIKEDMQVTGLNTGTATLYVLDGVTVTIKGVASAGAITVFAAKAVSQTDSSVKYYYGGTGDNKVAVTADDDSDSVTIKATLKTNVSDLAIGGKISANGKIAVTGAAQVASTGFEVTSVSGDISNLKYGILKIVGIKGTYSAVGVSETIVTPSEDTSPITLASLKVQNASVDLTNTYNSTVKTKISMVNIEAGVNKAITFVFDGFAAPCISGEFGKGIVTMKEGKVTVDDGSSSGTLIVPTTATLNAYSGATFDTNMLANGTELGKAQTDVVSSGSAVYAIGNIASNGSVSVGTDAFTAVRANITSVTINSTWMISISGDVAIDEGVISSLSGSLTLISGTFNTSENIDAGDTITVSTGSTLNLGKASPSTVAINLYGKMNVYGTLISYDADSTPVEITITVKKQTIVSGVAPGEFRSFDGSSIHQTISIVQELDTDGTYKSGIIDIATETKTVSGTTMGNEKYTQSQNVVVDDSYDVKNNSTVTILGGFEVPEGTTVTIYAGSKIVVSGSASEVKIAGKVIVEKGGEFQVDSTAKSVEISGIVESEEDDATTPTTKLDFSAQSVEIKNGGKIISGGLLDGSAMTVGEGSELDILGQVSITNIYNKGTIIFNDAVITTSNDVTISNIAAGAEVNVVSFKSSAIGNDLVINDTGLKYAGSAAYGTDNVVTIAPTHADTGHSGIKVISSVAQETIDGEVKNCKYLSIEGTISVYPSDATGISESAYGIKVGGPRMLVTGDLLLGEKVRMTVDDDATLSVSGTITAIQNAPSILATAGSSGNGIITVTGEIVVKTKDGIANINAALYNVKDAAANTIYHYTTLAKAIEAGATEIDLFGTVAVMDSLDIPTGVTVKTGTATVSVGSTDARDVTVKFADGAILKGTSGVTVNGTLEFANKANLKVSVTSDVAVVGDVTAKYTNIFSAVNGASAGDEITVTAASVTINADLTVKEGVTLKVPAGKTITVSDNVTVTVDGTVIAYSGFSAATEFDVTEKTNRSALVVNGKFLTAEALDTAHLNAKYHTAGAYYDIVGADGTYTYISPVDIAAASAKSAGTIDIYGKVSFGDVKVEADKDNTVIINLTNGSVVAGNLDITSYVTVDAVDGARFDGSIASSVGGVKVVNATVFTVAGKVLTDGTEILSVKGTPVKVGTESTDPKSSFAITEGIVTADGTSTNKFDATEVQSFSIAEGAVLNVTGAADVKNLSVAGTLSVANAGVLTVEGYIQVLGTLTVAEYDATKNSAAGTANIEVMYVGITKTKTTGAAATVTAPAISGLKTVYLAAGSTVSEKVLENLGKTTKFTVEGAEYLTVYTSQNILVSSIVNPELDGAKVLGWQYTNSSGKLADASDKIIGDIKEASAQMKYDVYTVSFLVDSGISDVYIDGELVGTEGLSQNYRTANITAGAHQITYKLKAGFGGDVKVTFNGQAAADGKFNISKDMPFQDDNGTAITYKIVISGVALEPIIEPEQKDDSGMGITDYLLIILVILAAILVVVVAIRMMRS